MFVCSGLHCTQIIHTKSSIISYIFIHTINVYINKKNTIRTPKLNKIKMLTVN